MTPLRYQQVLRLERAEHLIGHGATVAAVRLRADSEALRGGDVFPLGDVAQRVMLRRLRSR